MAIRCSIVGCEYDDTHIEREEERRGEEVILTVREFKECARCGNTELISENTGVTSIERPESTGDEATDGADERPDTGSPAEPATTEETPIADPEGTAGDTGSDPDPATTDDAVVLDEGTDPTPSDPEGEPATADPVAADPDDEPGTTDPVGSEPWPGEASEPASADAAVGGTADAGESTTADPAEDEAVTDDAVFIDGTGDRTGGLDEAAAMDDGPTITGSNDEEEYPEDDAVILDSSGSDDEGAGVGLGGGDWPDAGETTAGGWPEHDDRNDPDGRADAAGWPDAEGDDEGWDARTDDGDDAEEDVEFSGLTPTGSETAGAVTKNRPLSGESEAVEAGAEPATGGSADATAGVAPEATADEASPHLCCSGCGHAVDRESSPHRAGDICPDCSREYLAER